MTSIAIFLMDFDGGGAEKAMLFLANDLAQQGYDVDLVLVQAVGPYLDKIDSEVNIVDLQVKRLLFSLPRLIKYLREQRPNVLLSTLGDTNLIALWARWLANVPTRSVLSIQNHVSIAAQNATKFKHKLTPFFASVFYPWADEIVAVSQGVAEDLSHITGVPLHEIKVIYNPIITSDFFEQSLQPVNNPWLMNNEQSQYPVILGVGRLEQQKDFHSLILAFSKVRHHYPARLIILGEGGLRASLEELIRQLNLSDCVDLPGFVDNPYSYMKQASVFVLSSIHEGFGNVIGEALATGTPVVSTNCKSGPSEILDEGKYGKLVTVGDVDEMAKAIMLTLENPPSSQILCQRGNQFSVRKASSEYIKVLQPDTNAG